MAYDTWGGSWGTSWALSWTRDDVPPVPDNGWLGGGLYLTDHQRRREEEYRRKQLATNEAKLEQVDEDLAKKEQEQKDLLAKSKAKRKAKKLAAQEQALLDEINRLRMERVWLIRRINNERAILIAISRKKRLRTPVFIT